MVHPHAAAGIRFTCPPVCPEGSSPRAERDRTSCFMGVAMNGTASLTIPADLNEILTISAALESLMQAHGFPEEDILDTQLAVEEAVTNSIVHGYGGTTGTVTVSLDVTRSRSRIRIEDEAVPVDPLSLPEPELEGDLEERQLGGLGVFLIRQVMDEVSYRYEDGKNILSLIKRKKG